MHTVSEEQSGGWRIGPPLAEHLATHGRAAGHRLGHPGPQYAFDPHDIPLPATPGERVSLLQEKAPAKVLCVPQIGCLCNTVKHPKCSDAPSVHHLKEQTAIAAPRIGRL